MSELACWLWLRAVLGPGARGMGELLALYGSPSEVQRAVGREDFSSLLTSAQSARLTAAPRSFEALQSDCRRLGVQLIAYDEAAYPPRLKAIDDAPPVLFCTGDASALNAPHTVGMIGSRRPSAYGVEAAAALGDALAGAGVCLVSGLADGLDSEAHRAALRQNAPTVGVLGTSIDKTYPAANRTLRRQMEAVGAVISEYAPGEATGQPSFLQRNRLIAALSDALCVVEAREKSGTMNTVSHAIRYGRPVYAVPGGIFSELCGGTNQLLAEGRARAVQTPALFLQVLGLTAAKPSKHAAKPTTKLLSREAEAMLKGMASTPCSLEILAGRAELTAPQALAALLELEMADLAVALAGGQYRRK